MKNGIAIIAFALLLLSTVPTGNAATAAACSSYGEACSATLNGCCSGLKCDDGNGASHKCTQQDMVCDINPSIWTPTSAPAQLSGTGLNVTESVKQLQNGGGLVGGSGVYQVGWFNNWQTAGLIGVMIAIFLIALAAMVGHSFNMPEVKAFVDTELMQALVSVLLIVGMMGLISFFDEAARISIVNIGTISCAATGEPCYVTVARQYLQSYYDIGSQYASSALSDSVRYQNFANQGRSIQANLWWLGFAGVNFRLKAGLSIEAERAGAVFETMSKLLASIYAQLYFIDVISYGIAPILLLLGILLRTFFFTRKLGGLLLAIALALFIAYPLTYALSWYTLQVNLYGDRITQSEQNCPSECTMKPPAAFYISTDASGDGHLAYFNQVSDLATAGITKSNFATGDINNNGAAAYPGLVACTDMATLPDGTTSPPPTIANQCGGCPDYCREVPTPNQYPECRSAACSICDPGCKIMRLRTNDPGNTEDSCAVQCPTSACPMNCRTTLPVENKCYAQNVPTNTGTVVKANLSVSCGGCSISCLGTPKDCSSYTTGSSCTSSGCTWSGSSCSGQAAACATLQDQSVCQSSGCKYTGPCPNWCLLRKQSPDGTISLVYNSDPACANNPSCLPPSMSVTLTTGTPPLTTTNSYSGTCSDQCTYITEVGSDTNCKTQCTDAGVSCPEPCRVVTDPSVGFPPYDPEGFNSSICRSSKYLAACTKCPDICKVAIPPDPRYDTTQQPPSCAPYPASPALPLACTSCPDYCRFTKFDFIPGISNTVRTDATSNPPNTPAQTHGDDCTGANVKCSASDCDKNTCQLTGVYPLNGSSSTAPPVCRPYAGAGGDSPSTDMALCHQCPEECRTTPNSNDPKCSGLYGAGGACSDNCPAYCKVAQGNSPPICSEYIGYGAKDGVQQCWAQDIPNAKDCWNIGPDSGRCSSTAGCKFGTPSKCFGPSVCTSDPLVEYAKAACEQKGSEGCMWKQVGDPSIPIDYRDIPAQTTEYTDRTLCKQCPENCRLGSTDSSCGQQNNNNYLGQNDAYVDCSVSSCPLSCRVQVPPPVSNPPNGCNAFIPFNTPGFGCPVLCRRGDSSSNPSNTPLPSGNGNYCQTSPYGAACSPYDPGTGVGLTSGCTFADAPAQVCGGCFSCPVDCVYKPAVRSDCVEVCTDSQLGDLPQIDQGALLKSLPGARGRTDVRNAGIFMLPALVLPLFNIVVIIAFIRVFSPTLGGDIEIPGLSRIL